MSDRMKTFVSAINELAACLIAMEPAELEQIKLDGSAKWQASLIAEFCEELLTESNSRLQKTS